MYTRWLLQSLRSLSDLPPDLSEADYDSFRETIREAGERGALAGVPEAVKLCDIREGGIKPAIAREILAACHALAERTQRSETGMRTPNQAAKLLEVGYRTVMTWIRSGELAAVNVARAGRGLPRWKVSEKAIAEFIAETGSQSQACPAPSPCRDHERNRVRY
ncbi:MAG TPA: helix-turn-helix domain-containing protein [Pirellulaceae bacterium]|jgi:excisionase family DNA binding protein|nr:helix-turn-helix domain-containing protein [Pirellulaceae bacterium]